jgi:hypothetical protein
VTDVGVLLPLRLETRFDGTRLRLRVVPDEPWFDRHDPLPSATELDGLDRYLTAAGGRPDDDPAAAAAWEVFARQHGPGRATWLLRSFPDATRPPVVREEARFTALADLPEQLEVWLARGGGAPALTATLVVDPARLRLDPADRDQPGDRRWWESWDEAVAAGLAGEIDLGARADDIDVLYVVGLGTATPDRLLASHRDAGQLGLVAYGTPTNSVDGAPAADLGRDPAAWRALRRRQPSPTEQQVSLALTGDPDLLGPLPGDAPPQAEWTRRLVAGLWPALWGHTLRDVLGLGGQAEQLGDWALANLHPAGPYPAVRVGTQPYGLLPATSLTAWRPAPGDPAVEAGMPAALALLRARWARAAESAGRTVEGADSGRLLDLIAQPPATPGHAARRLHPLELWFLALHATGTSITWPDLAGALDATWPLTAQLGLAPRRRYGARGTARQVGLPPVVPPRLPAGLPVGEVLRNLVGSVTRTPDLLATPRPLVQELLWGGSLLLVLAVRALQLAVAEVGRVKLGAPLPALEPVAADPAARTRLAEHILAVTAADLAAPTPQAAAFHQVAAALDQAGEIPGEELERLLPATIDCAGQRVDAWVGGLAQRRLQALLAPGGAAPPARLRLGAYGWVDRPRPGRPGPTTGGLLHAPSATQAVTAALLRDRAVRDPEPGRWHMDVTSAPARRAGALAAEVRFGGHLAEVLGREVERVVGDLAAVMRLRERFPVRTEHTGRRVCNGQQVLDADPATLGLDATALAELARLRQAVDAYGDLLVAEAVHHVVEGRPEAAGAAMDAAAGLAGPPALEVLRTQREGRAAETACAVVLADRPAPALPPGADALAAVSPAALADPAAAATVAERLGGPAEWTWSAGAATVTLADLELTPAEALALPLGDLERLALAAAGAVELTGRDGSLRYERARGLVALLGQVPASATDLAEVAGPGAHPPPAAELRDRLGRLRTVAAALVDRLGRAATAGERARALRLAARWGIAPAPAAGVADPLADQADRARRLLAERLTGAPDLAAAGAPDHLELARAIAGLASATGQVAVLGRLRRDALPAVAAAAPGPGPGGGLDAAWLRVVAAVRAPLARLEAAQLLAGTPAGAGPPLVPWANRAADPWQTDPADRRRLVVAYAPGDLDLDAVPADRQLAAGLVDRFAETIPGQSHTTTAAVGFDAPGARAPQAILLAVPPDPTRPLDTAAVLRIVAETRELAHARMAVPADLEAVAGFAPLPLLPATGQTAIPLDPQ